MRALIIFNTFILIAFEVERGGLFPFSSTRSAKLRLAKDFKSLILKKSMGFRKPYRSRSEPNRLKGTKITRYCVGALQARLYVLQNSTPRLHKANSA